MALSNNQQAFFALLRAGLWEKDVELRKYESTDFEEILCLAEEQSVVGLIAAGLEHVVDKKPVKQDVLQFIGQALQLEQQNEAMNYFIGVLVDKMRAEGIDTLLVKGQGVAQCYERPLWRSCGDVDFFLSDENYEKAKQYLVPLASHVESENKIKKHLGLTIDPWVVELHGSLRGSLSRRINNVLEEIKRDTFQGGYFRTWMNGNTPVFLLKAENDALYVFTHFFFHFYSEGVGLRQICDWCRLLWTYRTELDLQALEQRIRQMGLMTEWRAFGAFAVECLGMPAEAMPFYVSEVQNVREFKKLKKKADRICSFIIEVGNFGHNRDNSYFNKPFVVRKAISFGRRCGDLFRHARIFPLDSFRFLPGIVFNGVRAAIKGQHDD